MLLIFAYDESGDFKIPATKDLHRVAVVLGIAISDIVKNELFKEYMAFIDNLPPNERRDEPKGSNLSQDSLMHFCEILKKYDGVSITPVTLDLTSLTETDYSSMNLVLSDELLKRSEQMYFQMASDQLNLLSRQVKNLSAEQTLRLYCWANCFRESIQHAILFLSNRGHENSWDDLRFEIDAVQARKNSREEQVFSFMIFSWLTGWSAKKPFYYINEIHTEDHQFVRKYDTPGGVDIGKLLRGNIYWLSSKHSIPLQMSDLASNIVYRAVTELDDSNGSLSLYTELMKNSYYGYKRGSGFFSPISCGIQEISIKYKPISEAMKKRKDRDL